MKFKHYLSSFFLLLGIVSNICAQKIEITTNSTSPFSLFQDVLFEVYLTNNTETPLKYFDSRYTSWDCFDESWSLKIDGHSSELYSFSDAHEGKYSEKYIITLQPGEKKHIRSRLIKIKSPGHYKLSYSQRQSPSLIKKHYAKSASAYSASQTISDFTVSNSIEFDVQDIQTDKVDNLVKMTWEEWLKFKQKELYENNNYFSNLEDALNTPEQVYSLNIGCDGLSEDMIKRIGNLKNLKSLSLSNFNLDILPKEIAELDLFELVIYPKQGKNISFSHGISLNNSLHSLTAKFYNGLPKEVLSLSNLEELDIRYCPLYELPNLSSLSKLKILIANDTQLKSIENIGLESLSQLKEIDISGNSNIKSIESLMGCKKLEKISCSRGNLNNIPAEIDGLSQLKEFDLAINRELTALPNSFVKLNSLRYLDISRTSIEILPEGFSKLQLEKILIYETKCKKSNDYKILKKRLKDNFRD